MMEKHGCGHGVGDVSGGGSGDEESECECECECERVAGDEGDEEAPRRSTGSDEVMREVGIGVGSGIDMSIGFQRFLRRFGRSLASAL